jgi:hypothetical protein
MFLQFSALILIKIELLFRDRLLAFLKIDGINMINTNQAQQEHTSIPRINPIPLQQRIGLMDQTPLINTNPILHLLPPNKAHLPHQLIPHNIINLTRNPQTNPQPLKHPKILPNEPLCRVLLVVQVDRL